jgi:hypothetical protein
MKTIYKFKIEDAGINPQVSFSMPGGAQFRSLLVEDNRPVLYFELEPTHYFKPDEYREIEPRDFLLLKTGEPLPEGELWFCGSASLWDGEVVLHVYEDRNRLNQEEKDRLEAEAKAEDYEY